MKKLLLIVAVLLVQHIYAKNQDALVILSDKSNVTTTIANPISILTKKAIDRRVLPVEGRTKPDVMAQGQSATVVNEFDYITTNSGTSFSAHLFSNPTDEMGYGIPYFEDAYNALFSLSIEDQLLGNQFAIYPNPVSDDLYVSFPKDINSAQLTVYNVLGAKVMENKISVDNYNTNVSELNSGMYIAHIQSGPISNSFKFIKK